MRFIIVALALIATASAQTNYAKKLDDGSDNPVCAQDTLADALGMVATLDTSAIAQDLMAGIPALQAISDALHEAVCEQRITCVENTLAAKAAEAQAKLAQAQMAMNLPGAAGAAAAALAAQMSAALQALASIQSGMLTELNALVVCSTIAPISTHCTGVCVHDNANSMLMNALADVIEGCMTAYDIVHESDDSASPPTCSSSAQAKRRNRRV